MAVRHGSLLSLYQEWFGIGPYSEDPFGGVHGRNAKFKGWRKEAKIDSSLYSRNQWLVTAIMKEAKRTQQQPVAVIDEWEVLFKEANFVTGNFVVALQRLGKIAVRKSRGKTKKDEQQEEAAAGEGPTEAV